MYGKKEDPAAARGAESSRQADAAPRSVRLPATGYAAQRAALSPRPTPAVPAVDAARSASATSGGDGTTTTAAPPALAPAAATEPAAEVAPPTAAEAAPAPADTALTDELHLFAYDHLRKQAYSVRWMKELQRNLSVTQSGVADVPTVNAILAAHPITLTYDPKAKTQKAKEKQKSKNMGTVAKEMAAALKQLSASIPESAGAEHATAKALGRSGGAHGAGADTPEDLAFKAKGGYAGYVKQELKSGTFLDKSVLAHPDMHDRLANATAYLQAKFPHATTEEQLAKEVGVQKVVSFRPTEPGRDQMYHGLGFAIDLNPAQNNWHLGKTDTSWTLNRIIGNVNALFGVNEVRSALGMAANSKKESTAEAFDAISRSNANLMRYRELANDGAKLEAYLRSAECPAAAKALGLDHWKKVLAADERKMADPAQKLVGADGKSNHSAGFMDLRLETVQAMRDAGGLRWGGTDLGGDSGDLMHFDGGFMPTALSLRGQVSTARGEMKKAKEAAKTEGTPGG